MLICIVFILAGQFSGSIKILASSTFALNSQIGNGKIVADVYTTFYIVALPSVHYVERME